MLSVDGSIDGVVDGQRAIMECLMDHKVHRARLIRESMLLLASLLKLVAVVVELVNKAVNCRHAHQL
jgi:hypothetical protein